MRKVVYLGFIPKGSMLKILPAFSSLTATIVSYVIMTLLSYFLAPRRLKNQRKCVYNRDTTLAIRKGITHESEQNVVEAEWEGRQP